MVRIICKTSALPLSLFDNFKIGRRGEIKVFQNLFWFDTIEIGGMNWGVYSVNTEKL